MNAPTFGIPESLAGDPSDVADALEVARALWGKGEAEEAIRWLRRAVTAASDADDAVRAANLAGVAADLEEDARSRHAAGAHTSSDSPDSPETIASAQNEAASAASLAPPAAPTAPVSAADGEARNETVMTHERADAAPTGEPTTTVSTSSPGAPGDRPADTGHEAPASPSTAPYGTIDAAAEVSHAPMASSMPPMASSMPPMASSMPPMAPIARAPGSVSPPRVMSTAPPRATITKPPAVGHPGPAIAPVLPAKLRVAVKSSVRDATLLLVRALADGEAPPLGASEAFLVRVEHGADAPPDATHRAAHDRNGSAEG